MRPVRELLCAFLVVACAVAAAPVRAQGLGLYSGEAPVADQSDEQRAAGMSAALSQVVVKLTGDPAVVSREAVAKALGEAGRYAQRYSYRQDVVAEGGQPQVKLTLVAQFDRAAIDRLLRDFGLKAWSAARPPVLVFLAVDDGNGLRLVTDPADAAAQPLLQAAQQRGLNLALPNLADADAAALGAQAAWSGDLAALAPQAARAQTALLLVGQLRRLGEQWSAHWTLSDGSAPQSWDGSDASLDALLAQAAAGAADRVVGRYAAASLERRPTAATVWISGIQSAADYARALAALGRDNLVRDALPQQARGDGLLVRLNLNVTLDSWLANLGADGVLRAVSARPPLDGIEATLALVH